MSTEALYFDNPVPSSLKFSSEEARQLYLSNIAFYKGETGKSAYQSYLENTTDNPPLNETEWVLIVSNLQSKVGTLENKVAEVINMPSDVLYYTTYLEFSNVGKADTLYIDTTTNLSYRWDDLLLKYYTINELDINIINGNYE